MNKKLLVALTVIGTIGAMTLVSCGNTPSSSSSSSVAPIDDIEITKPSEDIVVGDIIDLDAYVTVIGGTSPSAYTVNVRPASKDVVSLEGHTLTVLKEGAINLIIEAGDQSALISWEALSALKAAYKKATDEFGTNYGTRDLEVSSSGNISLDGYGNIHNDHYFFDIGNYSSGVSSEGMAILSDNRMYDFEADDLDGTNLDVKSGGTSSANWEYYFVNMGFSATYDLTEYVEDEDGYGSLVIDSSVPVPSGMDDYAFNMPDYILLTTWGYSIKLQDDDTIAQFNTDSFKIVITELGEYEDGSPIFGMEFTFNYSDAIIEQYGSQYAQTFYMEFSAIGGDNYCHMAALDDYIAAGTLPAAIDSSEIGTSLNTFAQAKAYTVNQKGGWYKTKSVDGTAVDPSGCTMESTLAGYYGEDTAAAVMSAFSSFETVTNVTDTYTISKDTGSDDYYGMAEKDGAVYEYGLNEAGDGYEGTAIDGATSLWDDMTNYLVTAAYDAATDDAFVVTDRTENSDGSVTFSFSGDDAQDLIDAAYRAGSNNGMAVCYYINAIWTSGTALCDGSATVYSDGSVEVNVYFTWSSGFNYVVRTVYSAAATEVPSLPEFVISTGDAE